MDLSGLTQEKIEQYMLANGWSRALSEERDWICFAPTEFPYWVIGMPTSKGLGYHLCMEEFLFRVACAEKRSVKSLVKDIMTPLLKLGAR